jgi:hypothetical protein
VNQSQDWSGSYDSEPQAIMGGRYRQDSASDDDIPPAIMKTAARGDDVSPVKKVVRYSHEDDTDFTPVKKVVSSDESNDESPSVFTPVKKAESDADNASPVQKQQRPVKKAESDADNASPVQQQQRLAAFGGCGGKSMKRLSVVQAPPMPTKKQESSASGSDSEADSGSEAEGKGKTAQKQEKGQPRRSARFARKRGSVSD